MADTLQKDAPRLGFDVLAPVVGPPNDDSVRLEATESGGLNAERDIRVVRYKGFKKLCEYCSFLLNGCNE